MKFFIEFLHRFNATDLLHMYESGAFRTTEENQISPYDLRIYKNLQAMVEKIRVQRATTNRPTNDPAKQEESGHLLNTDIVEYNYFVKLGENQREIKQSNLLERRLIFAFKPMREGSNPIVWIAEALEELLNYVMRDFEANDRVGLAIQYEKSTESTAIPIRLKNQLTTCVVKEALLSVINSKEDIKPLENMTLQVVRIRLPPRAPYASGASTSNQNLPSYSYSSSSSR